VNTVITEEVGIFDGIKRYIIQLNVIDSVLFLAIKKIQNLTAFIPYEAAILFYVEFVFKYYKYC
jgi:hypothetical protein